MQDLLDTPTSDRWYIDRDQQVRVRVEADEFYENEPGPMKIVDGILQQGAVKRPPYTLIVRFSTLVSFAQWLTSL